METKTATGTKPSGEVAALDDSIRTNGAPQQSDPKVIRPGSLGRLDVSIPEDGYQAGKAGTVRIIIRNPFDVPVDILEIQRPRSSYLCDIPEVEPKNFAKPGQPTQPQGWFRKLLKGAAAGAANVAVSAVSFAGMSAEFAASKPTLNIKAEKGSKLRIDPDCSRFQTVNVQAEDQSEVEVVCDSDPKPSSPSQRIEPHCDIVAYFQIQTDGWLLFKPTRMDLNTQIRYLAANQERTQVVSCCLDVKPPLGSIVMGALCGAFLGSLARSLQPLSSGQSSDWSWRGVGIGTGSAMVLSLIATVALSRKSGSQGFITVEDFFGGFVIGTLIGYQGAGYFNQHLLTQIQHDTAGANPPGAAPPH